MAGTTRLELATSAVTVQQPEVTSCNFTAPIATLGALRNPRELLLHPNCTQILFSDLVWNFKNTDTPSVTNVLLPILRARLDCAAPRGIP